jgi:hypothetical protein
MRSGSEAGWHETPQPGNAVRGVKTALQVRGLGNGKMRPPYQPFSDAAAARLLEELETLNVTKLEELATAGPGRVRSDAHLT